MSMRYLVNSTTTSCHHRCQQFAGHFLTHRKEHRKLVQIPLSLCSFRLVCLYFGQGGSLGSFSQQNKLLLVELQYWLQALSMIKIATGDLFWGYQSNDMNISNQRKQTGWLNWNKIVFKSQICNIYKTSKWFRNWHINYCTLRYDLSYIFIKIKKGKPLNCDTFLYLSAIKMCRTKRWKPLSYDAQYALNVLFFILL